MDRDIIPENQSDGELTQIVVKGARQHNLKNADLTIPRDKLVVVTGLSGSGKSSLAFDTLYAEGQRRYVDCLSPYARQFLGVMKKPEVDRVEGLSPAISIEQKSIGRNPRSTVGTTTEIYDYLRLLFARAGVQYCVECRVPVVQKSIDQICEEILKNFPAKKIQILAPIVRARKGHYKELFASFIKQGFARARVDGEVVELKENMQVSRYKIHDIELVVDRCVVDESRSSRLFESIQLAADRGEGAVSILVEEGGDWREETYSTAYSCPSCGKAYDALAPNMFSFNSPYGACPVCEGIGEQTDFAEKLVVPNLELSINDGGIAILGKRRDTYFWAQAQAYAKMIGLDLDKPISIVEPDLLEKLLYGEGKEVEIPVEYNFKGGRKIVYKHKFGGILPTIRHQYENTNSGGIRRNIESYMSSVECPSCGGGRLKKESLSVLIDEKNISEITQFDIAGAKNFFADIEKRLDGRQNAIASPILKEIRPRLDFLINVGLAYLSLDRKARTLSGGEAQRIRLASQIGSQLVGALYVLDEPSIGLHQHDNGKLIDSLKALRDLGNSVIVVEHDKAMIESADFIVDVGPGAGVHGGEIVFAATPDKMEHLSQRDYNRSLTAQYILGDKKIEYSKNRREGNGKSIILKGARGNNLKNVTLKTPLGKFVCVTGMSGSGKSSLINDTLYPILSRKFYRSTKIPLPYDSIEGLEYLDKVIEVDQSPIGRTPRSNPATYTGVFTQIRDFYSMLPESKIRGYKPGRFSFNVKEGRCDECEGGGIKKIEMNFLPEVYVKCAACDGKRYNKETLQVKYKGKSIADALAMTVEEAIDFFSEIPKIRNKFQTLYDVGLGYITLGQQAPTLSGGEAQRVKLAAELSKTGTANTLYLLDEPTTGLHFEDARILLKLLDRLVDRGATVIVIEHNLDVIKYADWIIDLGPEGGAGGGRIVAEGTPEDIAKNTDSLTGKYLAPELDEF